MAKNRTLQRMRRRLVYWAARLAQALFRLLPFDAAMSFGGWIGRLAFALLGGERRRTIQHLTRAFGREKDAAELRRIARDVFIHAGRAVAEIALLERWTDPRLRERIEFDNPEAILEQARAGKGCVILTAHYGNWELFGLYAVRILGLRMGVIARHLSNPHLDRLITESRTKMGFSVFFRGDRATGFVRHLLKGGMLAILGDQDIKKLDGIFVDFFGRPAHTLTGPAELIVRTGAPWFVAVLQRKPGGQAYRAILQGPFEAPEGGDRSERVRKLTEQYTRRIEDIIRENPEQWMWMHNRWKSQVEN